MVQSLERRPSPTKRQAGNLKSNRHMCKCNRIVGWPILGAVGMVFLGSVCHAQILSIDMDPLTAGIQNTLAATAGQNISVDIMLQPGATGVSVYVASVRFDNTELSYTGDVEAPPPPLPAGLANVTVGSGGLVMNVAPGLDQVSSFEAGTLGMGPVGPPAFVIGTINFTVVGVANDGLADLTPGFFSVGDGMVDNAGAALAPVFNPGFVIPEPATVFGAALLLGFASFHAYRRIRRA